METTPSDHSDHKGRQVGPEAPRGSRKRGAAIQAPELHYHEVEQGVASGADLDAAYDILFEAVLRRDQETPAKTRGVSTDFLKEVARN